MPPHRYDLNFSWHNIRIFLIAAWAVLVLSVLFCILALYKVLTSTPGHHSWMFLLEAVMLIPAAVGSWEYLRKARFSVAVGWPGRAQFFILFVVLSPVWVWIAMAVFFVLGIRRLTKRFFPTIRFSLGKNRLQSIEEKLATVSWPDRSAMSSLAFPERMARWRALNAAEKASEDAIKLAGDQGERDALAALERDRSLRGTLIFANKRLVNPAPTSLLPGKRTEVDLILLTKKAIHVIEVKNFSGDLYISSAGDWIQKRRSTGQELHNPNLVLRNAEKCKAVLAYLHNNGVPVDSMNVKNHVFFTNPNLNIDPKIAAYKEVVTWSKMSAFRRAVRVPTLDRLLVYFSRFILDGEKSEALQSGLYAGFTEELFDRSKSAIRELPTWDRLILYGGREVSGDCLRMNAWESACPLGQLRSGEYYEFRWNRSRVGSLLFSFVGWPLGKIVASNHKVPADAGGHIYFHPAGSAKPQVYSLAVVDRFIKG